MVNAVYWQGFISGILAGVFVWGITVYMWKPRLKLSNRIAHTNNNRYVFKLQNNSWFKTVYDITFYVQYRDGNGKHGFERLQPIGMLYPKCKWLWKKDYIKTPQNAPNEQTFMLKGYLYKKEQAISLRSFFEENNSANTHIEVVAMGSDVFTGSIRAVTCKRYYRNDIIPSPKTFKAGILEPVDYISGSDESVEYNDNNT